MTTQTGHLEQERAALMRTALEMVLLYHNGGGWTDEQGYEWSAKAISILGSNYNPHRVTLAHDDAITRFECTARVLCDVVRKALE